MVWPSISSMCRVLFSLPMRLPLPIKASAQGIFMMMTNGLGSIVGGYGAGLVIAYHSENGVVTDWPACWTIFAAYACVIGILFALTFHYKHQAKVKAEKV